MKKYLLITFALLASFNALAQWQYDSKVDQMTSKTSYRAYAVSDNSLDLARPYAGQNNGVITVRKHPQHGLDVLVQIQKGQILCPSYSGCDVVVRFDEKPPVVYPATPPDDHTTTVVFLKRPEKFIAEASKAKKILVGMKIYQSGNPVLSFSTPSPLVWKPGKP